MERQEVDAINTAVETHVKPSELKHSYLPGSVSGRQAPVQVNGTGCVRARHWLIARAPDLHEFRLTIFIPLGSEDAEPVKSLWIACELKSWSGARGENGGSNIDSLVMSSPSLTGLSPSYCASAIVDDGADQVPRARQLID